MNDRVNPANVEAANRLRAVIPDEVGPDVADLAGLMASRIETQFHDLLPTNFYTLGYLIIEDLRQGKNGFAEEPSELEHRLVGQDGAVYEQLTRFLPRLAEVAVSTAFGQELRGMMVEGGLIPAPEVNGDNQSR